MPAPLLLNPANAPGRVLAMLISGLLIAVTALSFRWNGLNTAIIMCSQLNVFMNYDIDSFSERASRVFRTTLYGGCFQFAVVMLSGNRFLLLYLLFSGSFLILYLMRDESAEAILIVIIGVLSLSGNTGGYVLSLDRLIFLQYSALYTLTGIQIMRWIIPHKTELTAGMPKHTLTAGRSFMIAVQITFGIWLWQATQLPQGIWIALTMLLTHIGGIFGDRALLRASTRMLIGPAGFLAGFLYLGIFCWFDYRMAYAFPLFLAMGFYVFFRTGSYSWNMFFQMIFFVLLYDILNGEYRQLDILNLLICRTTAILSGGFLAIFSDPERNTPAADLIRPL